MGRTHEGKYKLTWIKASRRWRKKYKGKDFYFPLVAGETKESSYTRCHEEWKAKRLELDRVLTSPFDLARDRIRQRMQTVAESGDTPENRQSYVLLQGAVSSLTFAEQDGYPVELVEKDLAGGGFPLLLSSSSEAREAWLSGPAPWDNRSLSASETVAGNVKDFLKAKNAEAVKGSITIARYDRLRAALEDFSAFAGNKPLTGVTSLLLEEYHRELEKRIAEGKASATYLQGFIIAAKQFARWAYDTERLESLPRILESKGNNRLSITVPTVEIETFTKAELTTLLRQSPDDLKLYVILMLNCGMTQKDVSDLLRSEVDLAAKTITRKRSKTGNHENTPLVTFPLWPETLRLLAAHIQPSGDLALRNSKGNPLLTEKLTKGKRAKVDNIGLRYHRFRKKLTNKTGTIDKPLKALRATGASTLGEHGEYNRFAHYYLGHSPRSIADKHYVKPSPEEFAKAIHWLGTQLGIVKAKKKAA